MPARRLDEIRLTGSLPSPTGIGLEILRLTSTDDYCLAELARVVQADPALTGRVIKLANSAANSGVEPARTVEKATISLGVRTVRNLALSFSLVAGNRSGTSRVFDHERYWSRSLAEAVAAQNLAGHLRSVPGADAFTCALLSGIGRLALATVHAEGYDEVLTSAQGSSPEELLRLERRSFDVDHCELAAAMLEDWKLPRSFSWAASNLELGEPDEEPPCEEAQSLRMILRVSQLIGRMCVDLAREDGARWVWGWPELEEHRRLLGIEAQAFRAVLDRVAEEWPGWGHLLEVPTCSLPSFEEIAGQVELLVGREGAESPGEGEAEQARKGLRILAVDDAPVSLRLLVHHLTRDGHTVAQATDGRQALSMAMADPPQLVVTDWMMPEMDGIDFCKALRRTTIGRNMYVLVLTGREDEERVVEAFDAGADDYVCKPFNPEILLARVRAGQRMIELREQVELDRRDRQRQVAEMAVLNRKLQAAALTDVLTELPNRRYAMKRLDQDLSTLQRAGGSMTVMMLDIDHFKRVNDEHGHDVGDHVLRETALALRKTCRKGDVVCRLGGEEFLVICSTSDLASARSSAERIRQAVEQNVIQMADFQRAITVSIGIAEVDEGLQTVDALLKEADLQVYRAKESGRNRVCWGEGDSKLDARSA